LVADVFGRPGRRALERGIERRGGRPAPDLLIVNGENAAGGFGITPDIVREFLALGVDVITTGNHVWDKRDVYELLDTEPRLLRPDNYPAGNPGRGMWTGEAAAPCAVLNLQGRVFMREIESPVRRLDTLGRPAVRDAKVVIVDFHAEATAEKIALGRYADGRVTAVVGTHTHVPSADARVLPGGTAYVTDAGMTGPHGGVIGVEADAAIERFLRLTQPVHGGGRRRPFQAVAIDVDGRAAARARSRGSMSRSTEGPAARVPGRCDGARTGPRPGMARTAPARAGRAGTRLLQPLRGGARGRHGRGAGAVPRMEGGGPRRLPAAHAPEHRPRSGGALGLGLPRLLLGTRSRRGNPGERPPACGEAWSPVQRSNDGDFGVGAGCACGRRPLEELHHLRQEYGSG
jgi:metallophosphoesterase (TIGR00282 family)